MSEKSKDTPKGKPGRPKVINSDFRVLDEIEDITNIPEVTTKVLKALGKGWITLSSAKEMINLLGKANAIAFSSLTRDMKEKYRVISEVSEMIQKKNLPALKTIDIDEDENDE